MRATPIACTLALLLAACGTQAPAESAAAPAASAPAEPAMPEPTPPADAPPATDAVPPADAGAAAAPVDETPVVPASMAGTCDASVLDWAIGQPGDDALLARAKAEAGAAHAQFLRPGMVMTMDYRPDRLVIVLDDAGRVESARCG